MAIDLSGKGNGAKDRVDVTVKVDKGQLMLYIPIDKLEKVKGDLSSTGKSMVLAALNESVILPNGRKIRMGLNVTEKVS